MPGTNPLPCSHSTMVYNTSKIVLLDTATGRGPVNGPGTTGSFFNETVTWSGDSTSGNWTVVSTSGIDPLGPLPVRNLQGMGFDSGSTEVVLFGGAGESEAAGVLNDTWTFSSGGVWTKQAPGTSPFGRYRHQMADLHGVGVLMFGGSNVLNFLEETWLWQGGAAGNWTQLTPGVVPPARVDFAMAGSSAATNVLMYGGKGTEACFGDTWMWVGSATGDWVQQFPAVSPPAMAESCMAYDAANSQYVMFGGRSNDNLLSPQTWVWTGGNGGNWHLATPAVTPAGRVGAQMAYDGTHVIMFGGAGNVGVDGGTWMWTGGTNGNWQQL
jgi:hypothetical protein